MVIWHHREQLTFEEIGRRRGISEEAARKLLDAGSRAACARNLVRPMIRDESLLCEGAALGGAEAQPATGSTQRDSPVDSASELDIEESLRLLDEIWPRDEHHESRIPRRFGRFSILGELGRGGFGVVYLAEDPLLGRKVALKLPRVEVLSGTEGWRRFLREARAASRLDHPNLIPLLEAGAIGPVGYIVSAYVAGPSLEQWLRHNRDGGSLLAGERSSSRSWPTPSSMRTSGESSTAT